MELFALETNAEASAPASATTMILFSTLAALTLTLVWLTRKMETKSGAAVRSAVDLIVSRMPQQQHSASGKQLVQQQHQHQQQHQQQKKKLLSETTAPAPLVVVAEDAGEKKQEQREQQPEQQEADNNNETNSSKSKSKSADPCTRGVAPPGPLGWPVIGSLHLLASHEVPFEAFSHLSRVYGDIFSITLGTTPCVVVNSFPLIKEVLITKGPHFGGRPNFIRYDILFGGDRDNSLALCDWSDLQKARRSLARHYCHPRASSLQFDALSQVLTSESAFMVHELRAKVSAGGAATNGIDLKPTLLAMCANVFTHYMCSSRFSYDNASFVNVVRLFDQIFWDINQGYAVDFLPWLLPIYRGHMQKLTNWGSEIRQFILRHIIDEHRDSLDRNSIRDFTDALLSQLEESKAGVEQNKLDWNHVLYELEDFLGGHSAIGNLLMRAVGELCYNPQAMANIQEEIYRVTDGNTRPVVLEDRPSMPYTESAILETLRLASSPIVPHVAMQNTSVNGFDIKSGTVVFLNNYELNISPDYWGEHALKFDPSRFIKQGKIVKPEYFIPFSTGKRACMGYRLVQHVSFVAFATLLQHFDVGPVDLVKQPIHLPKACVAVPPDAFHVVLTPRAGAAC